MKKSFTLVEMMIVVAIIAILSGVALPQYQKYVRKAEASGIISIINEIKAAEVIYKAIKGNFLEFNAAGNNHNTSKLVPFKTLGLEIPLNDYDYYVNYCSGINPGIIIRIRKIGGPFVYLAYPSSMTLSNSSDKSLLSNGFFIEDYLNNETSTSGKEPQCYTSSI